MIDLSPDHLAIVTAILRQYVPGLEIWVFGSRAKGTAKPFSDLDLAIISPTKLPNATIINLKQAFEDSDLPIKVDLVEFHDVAPAFQQIIRGEHQVLQKIIL